MAVDIEVLRDDDVVSRIVKVFDNGDSALFYVYKAVSGVGFVKGASYHHIVFDAGDDKCTSLSFTSTGSDEEYMDIVVEDRGSLFAVAVIANVINQEENLY